MPLYQELLTQIRDRILEGSFAPGMQLPTEHALAKQHHISRGTVRHAMSALVHEGLLERVQGRGTFVRQAAPSAEVIAPAATRRIGLILHHMSDQATLEIMVGVAQAAKARNYQVGFTYSDEQLDQEARDIARMRADRVAGVIIFPVSDVTYDPTIAQLQRDGIPCVLIDRYCMEMETDYVGVDNFGGGYRATQHLVILGHTRIGFVYAHRGSLSTTSVRDRHAGYRAALEEYGLPYDERLILRQPAASAYDAYLLQASRPSAIFAVNDSVALDLLEDARRLMLRVPDDLALVGFDDLSYAARLHPPLTTVAQPRMEIGLRAGNLLINRIEGQTGATQQIALPTNLIVRESCGARLRMTR